MKTDYHILGKREVLFLILILVSFMQNVSAFVSEDQVVVCTVSSDPSLNWGHCQAQGDGNYKCISIGSVGDPCDGSISIKN